MVKASHQEPTIQDVLDTVHSLNQDILDAMTTFATKVEGDIGELKQDVSGLKQDVNGLKQDVSGLKHDVAYLKNNMVTKDYLDTSIFKVKGEMGMWLRKEDDKVNELTGLLANKAVISRVDSKKIVAMGPFAKKA